MCGTKLRSVLLATCLSFVAAPVTFGQLDKTQSSGSKDQSTVSAPALSPKSSVPVKPRNGSTTEERRQALTPALSPKSSVPVHQGSTETAGPHREKPTQVLSPKSSVPVEKDR